MRLETSIWWTRNAYSVDGQKMSEIVAPRGKVGNDGVVGNAEVPAEELY
jgi:hypothetical protein